MSIKEDIHAALDEALSAALVRLRKVHPDVEIIIISRCGDDIDSTGSCAVDDVELLLTSLLDNINNIEPKHRA